MKKTLFIICILLVTAMAGNAQNYQCLQAGVKRYYTNSNGYLRGMRIDSVIIAGSDTVYYPFHTDRGIYSPFLGSSSLDSSGGSWLGRRVMQQADGTFLFDNMWADTVVIRTQAHTGDVWIFYNDTTDRYYTATLTGEDTMTILGALDSIKEIRINAFTTAGPDPADPADTFQLVLSKNHGFVRIFDLYTFPYHKPDVAYSAGIDYYLDQLMRFKYYWSTGPSQANSIFSLVDLVSPTYEQLYDWNPGDVFENRVYYGVNDGGYPQAYYYDSITARTPVSGGTLYAFTGWAANEYFPPFYFWSGGSSSHHFPYDTASTAGAFLVSNKILLDTMLMPEEAGQGYSQYYLPADTENCIKSARYILVETEINDHTYRSFFEASPHYREYKKGIGLTRYNWGAPGGSPPIEEDTTIIYFRKGGVTCGNYYTGFKIHDLAVEQPAANTLKLMPNPVSDELVIAASEHINHVQITNALGQTVFEQEYNSIQVTIPVQSLTAGIYFVHINDTEVRKIIKQ